MAADATESEDRGAVAAAAWTPQQGLRRALLWGSAAALGIGLVSGVVAWFASRITLHWLLRGAIAYGVGWLLFRVVHWAAGMAGGLCTGLVVVLAVLVMLSHHVVWTVHGIWTDTGVPAAGLTWLEPSTLLVLNIPTFVGLVLCVKMWSDG